MYHKIYELIDLMDRHGEVFVYGMFAGAFLTFVCIVLVAVPA